jgi:hypothetical protein
MEKSLCSPLNATGAAPSEMELHDMVELVDTYDLPANLVQWLSNKDYSIHLIHEQISAEKYTRIAQYRVQECLLFTGKAVFYLDKLDKSFTHALLNHKEPISSMHPHFRELEKKRISAILSDPYYTVISHLHIRGTIVGIAWEVYDLPPLIELYKQKKDPLHYWKMSRRG